jgi:glycosyltransferase involved in cell wall biosynthesis
MKLPLLVEPASGGRISGGFLYNTRMAEHGLWELADASRQELDALLGAVPRERVVLMDSIWLTADGIRPFLEHHAAGGRVGVMLHSFPSLIDATEKGLPPLARPSRFEVEALGTLDVVVVPGRHYRDLLGDCNARIVIAEPGIDDAWRTAPRRRCGPCRLISVGAVTPRKGFLDVLEVLEEREDAELTWAGVGSLDVDRQYASRVLQRARQRTSATLTGQLAPDATRRLVQQSDLLLMPSYDENQPLVLLEAMAASVPAIAYAAGATAHMLEHGREGLIAPVGDRRTFAAHLYRLLDDEDLRHEMATRCWQRQHSLPSWRDAAVRAQVELELVFANAGCAQ